MAVFNDFKEQVMRGVHNLASHTLKVMLTTSSYSPDIDAHTVKTDVTNEVSGTGYTAGGATLANVTVSQDNTDDEAVLDADDVTWSTATITARRAVLWNDSPTSPADPLICEFDFGSDKTSSGGNFTIQWNTEGILNLG